MSGLDETFFRIIGILFIGFALVIMIFCLLVIMIIIFHWRSDCRSIANLSVCNSCVALLFYAITLSIQIPFVIQNNPLHSNDMNVVFCKIRSFMATYATLVKSYSYLVMAITSFFVIVLYKHKILLSFRATWLIITASWILSAIITIGTFLSPLAYAYEPESGLCFLTTKHFATSFTVVTLVFVMTLGTMIILYGTIVWHVARSTRISPNSSGTKRAKRNMKVFKKILIFNGTLFIAGTPYFLCTILHRIDQAPWPLYAMAHLFIAFGAALESIVLLLTNEQVKRILCNKFRSQQVDQSNIAIAMNTNKVTQISLNHHEMKTIEPLPTVN